MTRKTAKFLLLLIAASMTAGVAGSSDFAGAQPSADRIIPMPPLRPKEFTTRKPIPDQKKETSQPSNRIIGSTKADEGPVKDRNNFPQRKPAGTPASQSPADATHPITAPGPFAPRRKAIRSCVKEWLDLQRTGITGDMLWRTFSKECIKRQIGLACGSKNLPPCDENSR